MGDREVLAAFADGSTAAHSERLHIEDGVLRVDVTAVLALRLAREVVLVRVDAHEDVGAFVAPLVDALIVHGLELIDERTLLAIPVALQLVGLRLSEWDLWGSDIDDAFARLRVIAVG